VGAPNPTLLAVAHGTSNPAGLAVLYETIDLAGQAAPDVKLVLSFIQLASPSLIDAVQAVRGPAVLVPLLLSTGYHVTTDITRAVSGRRDIAVTEPLGPDPRISAAAQHRLEEAASRFTGSGHAKVGRDRVVVSAGSSDPDALRQLQQVANHLTELAPGRVEVRQLSEFDPFAGISSDALVVNYLLAPGKFDGRLRQLAGARVVGEPIGAHPLVIEVVLERYRDGVRALESRQA
jgi:sirohydrochlorin ferrochelatase